MPTPSPAPEFNPDQVTPGIVGFVVTFLIMLATVLLIIDMMRRIRRTNYRAQVKEQLVAEQVVEQAEHVSQVDKSEPNKPSNESESKQNGSS